MYSVPVEEGDTIVMGSDGLFDNVFDNDIASIVDVFGGSDDGAPLRSGEPASPPNSTEWRIGMQRAIQ